MSVDMHYKCPLKRTIINVHLIVGHGVSSCNLKGNIVTSYWRDSSRRRRIRGCPGEADDPPDTHVPDFRAFVVGYVKQIYLILE